MASFAQDFGQREKFIATAALAPGDITQTPDGLACMVVGLKNIAIGEEVTVTTDAILNVPIASGATLSVGDSVQWDNGTSKAVAAGGAGDFVLGPAWQAKTSGQTVAKVRLNKTKIAMPS